MAKRMLLVFAHPDDESFVLGGTIAKASSEGAEIYLVSATRGEAGKTAGLCPPEKLGELREQELRKAAQVLGINKLSFLGYRDKEVLEAKAGEILAQLVKIIRAYRPHVVITFGADGASGHRDHRAIHHWTKAAVHLAAQATVPEWGEAYTVPRLCYVKPTWRITGSEKTNSDYVIPVGAFAKIKWQAVEEHKTQAHSIGKFAKMREALKKHYFSEEYFDCDPELSIYPGKGQDLFEGIPADEEKFI